MLKVLIVSLKQDVAKRKVISEKLNNLNVNFEFIDAIYGKSLEQTFFDDLQPAGKILNRGFLPTKGEVGCSLSHLKVYKKILQDKLEWACVLEDDAILDNKFSDFIENFNAVNFDNLYILGGQEGLDISSKLISKSIFIKEKYGEILFNKVIFSENYVNRTCCYVISKKTAGKMIAIFEEGFYLADDWYSFKAKCAFKDIFISNFVSHPVDLSHSAIEKERQDAYLLLGKNNNKIIRKIGIKLFFSLKYILSNIKRFYIC